jgi:capsule polysaccharide export protein KpsE/RkpR
MVWKDRMTRVADAERSVRFLQSQLGNDQFGATRALRDAEDALTAFRKRNKMLDIDTTLKTAITQAADLEQQKGELEGNIRQATASLAKTQQQLGGTEQFNIAPTISQNPLVDEIKGQLIQAQTELASLRGKDFTDEWPAVKAVKAQIAALEQQLRDQVRTSVTEQYTPDPVHIALAQKAADLASQKVGLEARQIAVDRLLGTMNGRFDSLPDKQADMVRLMRAMELSERQFDELYARLVDARNKKVMGQGNARVVQPAVEPGERVSPRKKNVAIAVVLGMFFGALCALVLSSSDRHIRTAEDVRRELNVPVLAHLPAIPRTGTLVVESMPASPITEAFRALRSTIRFMGADSPIQTLAATSTKAAEGKSTVVANLAASLAQAGLTVTAVDADLRRPRLASFFGDRAGDRPVRVQHLQVLSCLPDARRRRAEARESEAGGDRQEIGLNVERRT